MDENEEGRGTYVDFNETFTVLHGDELFVGGNDAEFDRFTWTIGRGRCLDEDYVTVVVDNDVTFLFETNTTSTDNL